MKKKKYETFELNHAELSDMPGRNEVWDESLHYEDNDIWVITAYGSGSVYPDDEMPIIEKFNSK